ncbi:MAG: SDR family oxidoreductase [Pseudomonadota bacterium]|nr:SDR family oxidoreductase [Pseudomonadota bacterium]
MESKRVVLVTGGAARIGRCIAEHLAEQGFAVALHYRSSGEAADRAVAALHAAGHPARSFAADLTDAAQCEALVPAVVQAFGRIDAIVNNASLFEYDNVESFSVERMESHWRANTAPAILLARALHRHGGGVVVNLLDQKLWNPNPDYLSYTLSKAALQTATTLLAQALAPTVRVCGVAPGVTLLSGEMSDAEFDASHTMTPLGRSSSPEDVARAVHFLIESPAITGTTLLVDGGQHLQPQDRDVMFAARESALPKDSKKATR